MRRNDEDDLKMNKKGFILHLAVVLFVLGIILFLALTNKDVLNIDIKGEWHNDFLTNNYLQAQQELLKLDIIAKRVGSEAALELAMSGGFLENQQSECGTLGKVNIWNNKDKWCFPDFVVNLDQLAKEKFALKGKESFKEINYNGEFFVGKGEEKTITSEVGTYTYDESFAVYLGYSFDKYKSFLLEAKKLVNFCNKEHNLRTCLDKIKLNNWEYGACGSGEVFDSSNRKIKFCVESPTQSNVLIGDTYKTVKYNLALDFTPAKALAVEELSVTLDGNNYKITFTEDSTAESYTLYYTNWQNAPQNIPGSAEQIFSLMPFAGQTNFYKSVAINSIESCSSNLEMGKAYLCNNKITYILVDNELAADKVYYFAVTSVKEGEESQISLFVTR